MALAESVSFGLASTITPALALRLESQCRNNGLVQVADALAVLGGDGDRLAQAELERLVEAVGTGPPLAFVGDQDDRPAGAAHDARECRVGRHHAVACVQQEEH